MGQSHNFVKLPAGLTDSRGDHIAALCLLVFQDAVPDMSQSIADHLRGDRSSLQGHAVLQAPDTEQGHEGDGYMGAPTSPYRLTILVVSLYPVQHGLQQADATAKPCALYPLSPL